jgi:hypothetical protein
MDSHTINNGIRPVYLPQPDNWYNFNLRIDGSVGVPLKPYIKGGSNIQYDASIRSDVDHVPYVTPIYVREGKLKLIFDRK